MCRSLLLGFSLLVGGICSCAVAQTEPYDNLREAINQNRLIAHDVAVFNFRQIAAPQTWVVANVKPDPFNPAPLIPSSDDNNILAHGSITILSILTGHAPPLARYQWEWKLPTALRANIRTNRYGGEEEGSNDFFRYGPGGTTIVRINDETSDDRKFSPAYLIPREWAAFVAPALKTKALPLLLFADLNLALKAQLEAALSDPNPFIAIEAARNLEWAQLLDADFVRGPLVKSRGFEQSAFAFLVARQLAYQGNLAKEPLLEDLGKAIDAAPDAQTLKSLSVGISALATEPSHFGISGYERAKWLLRRVDSRQKALGTHTAADAYLDLLLHTFGVRQTPAVPPK